MCCFGSQRCDFGRPYGDMRQIAKRRGIGKARFRRLSLITLSCRVACRRSHHPGALADRTRVAEFERGDRSPNIYRDRRQLHPYGSLSTQPEQSQSSVLHACCTEHYGAVCNARKSAVFARNALQHDSGAITILEIQKSPDLQGFYGGCGGSLQRTRLLR
jgi:hypothetical protein